MSVVQTQACRAPWRGPAFRPLVHPSETLEDFTRTPGFPDKLTAFVYLPLENTSLGSHGKWAPLPIPGLGRGASRSSAACKVRGRGSPVAHGSCDTHPQQSIPGAFKDVVLHGPWCLERRPGVFGAASVGELNSLGTSDVHT